MRISTPGPRVNFLREIEFPRLSWAFGTASNEGRGLMAASVGMMALSLLRREGMTGIWQLHLEAAALYQKGDRVAAESLVQIADAAEEIWWRHIMEASRSQ